jgi:predicted phosphodiesterase
VLERLRALGNVHWIRGNAERELLEPGPEREGGPPPGVLEELRAKMTDADVDFVFGLPEQLTLEVDGLGEILFCHATPRNDWEIFTILSPDARGEEMMGGVQQSVIVCGHTHVQDDRRVGEHRVVNAGSVGMPYEDAPGAYWALLGPDVELRRTTYGGMGEPQASRSEASEYFESIA